MCEFRANAAARVPGAARNAQALKGIAMRAIMLVPLFVLGHAAAAGMYDRPYALVERGDASATRNEAPVAVTKVDGRSARDPRTTDPLPPGRHVVTLHFETARGAFRPEYLDLEMDVAACTRYRIVASHENRMGPDWKPRVYAEPIKECERKFSKELAPAK